MSYLIPKKKHRIEEIIKRSKFIATIIHAPSPDSAKAFISEIKQEFPDATHNCWAFVSGPPGSTAHIGMSDDGEPRGTAGKPMLNTLLYSEIGEIAVVVTRYFGGIKLGTGGLVRAYSGVVKQALSALPVQEKIISSHIFVIIDYSSLSYVKHLADSFDAEIIKEQYQADVSLTFELPRENADNFHEALINITKGEIIIEQIESGLC
ncbi:Impact family protein [Desulfonema limicola]|uniref:Impact family protein n=1 Tax=Desulfonema limicola TaxID=45656 RepID=A0A975B9K9_9BACT|nr:YigZ family protein [Desulfonema limicola]QTA81182.1 Impact family protein [Desulfonema limicola]